MEVQSHQLQKYLKLLIARRYLFLTSSLIIMSIVVFVSFLLPKKYEASSTVFIERNVIKDLVKGIAITPSMEDRIRVLRYAMLSRDLILKVLKDLDVDTKLKKNQDVNALVTEFQQKTAVTVRGNDLFIVTLRDKNPKLAMSFVNTLVRKYVEENVAAKREEAYGAGGFLDEQVKTFKERMDRADEAVIKYRQSKGIYLSSDENQLIADIKQYNTELEKIRIRRNELVATRNSVKRQLSGEEPFTVSVLNRNKSGSSNNQITVREARINQLLVSYTENYPEIVKLRAEIDALKKQSAGSSKEGEITESEMSSINPIHQDLKQKLFQAEAEVASLDARQREIMGAVGAKERELRNMPEGKKILANLENERNASKAIYEQLIARQGQTEVSKQMEVQDKSTNFRIVDAAVLPIKPVSPNRKMIILLGVAAGIAGAIGILLLLDTFNTSLKEESDLKKLGIEVLAVIPRIFDEAEATRIRKKDRLVYLASAAYFSLICLILVHEVLGYTYIDSAITRFGLEAIFQKFVSGS